MNWPSAAVIAGMGCVAAIAAAVAVAHLAPWDDADRETPSIAVRGPVQVVFDWRKDRCSDANIPDLATRAFRDFRGRVRLTLAHYDNITMVGPRLDALRPACRIVLGSHSDPHPAAYDDRRWIASVYTRDGRTVYALIHSEYEGERHRSRCPSGDRLKCWYNAVTLAVSHDGGRSYRARAAPHNLVATIPQRYVPDAGPAGMFEPSNIVRNPRDGRFYALVRIADPTRRVMGTCLIRTGRLAAAAAWRGWDGRRFSVRFVDPYRDDAARTDACTPVSQPQIASMSESLTYNTHLRRFVLVGSTGAQEPGQPGAVWGFYYSLSRDLVHWTMRRLLMKAELPWTYACGDRDPVLYPSLIDPASRSRSFETTGRRPFLYFTRFRYDGCRQTAARDLVRRRVELTR